MFTPLRRCDQSCNVTGYSGSSDASVRLQLTQGLGVIVCQHGRGLGCRVPAPVAAMPSNLLARLSTLGILLIPVDDGDTWRRVGGCEAQIQPQAGCCEVSKPPLESSDLYADVDEPYEGM